MKPLNLHLWCFSKCLSIWWDEENDLLQLVRVLYSNYMRKRQHYLLILIVISNKHLGCLGLRANVMKPLNLHLWCFSECLSIWWDEENDLLQRVRVLYSNYIAAFDFPPSSTLGWPKIWPWPWMSWCFSKCFSVWWDEENDLLQLARVLH